MNALPQHLEQVPPGALGGDTVSAVNECLDVAGWRKRSLLLVVSLSVMSQHQAASYGQ